MEAHSSVTECPNCGSGFIQVDSTDGQLICTQCGRVLETSMVDHGADWNLVDNGVTLGGTSKDKARATQVTELDGEGGTFVGFDTGKAARTLQKCIKETNAGVSQKAKDAKSAKNLHARIKNVVTRLALPDEEALVDRVFEILRSVDVKPQTSMRYPFIIGGLFFALRMTNVPRGLIELCDLAKDALSIRLTIKTLRQNVMKLHKLIADAPDGSAASASMDNIKCVTLEDYLPRFCTRLGLPMNIERNARRILKDVEGSLEMKRNPPLIAATVICVAALNEDNDCHPDEVAKTLSLDPRHLNANIAWVKTICDRASRLGAHNPDGACFKLRNITRKYPAPRVSV